MSYRLGKIDDGEDECPMRDDGDYLCIQGEALSQEMIFGFTLLYSS
jgi:hypothetical protein